MIAHSACWEGNAEKLVYWFESIFEKRRNLGSRICGAYIRPKKRFAYADDSHMHPYFTDVFHDFHMRFRHICGMRPIFLQSSFMRKKCGFSKICVHFYLKDAYMRASKFSDILGNSNYFLGKLIFFFHDHPLA